MTVKLFGPEYRDRIDRSRRGEHGDECSLCGRPTKKTIFVNVDNGPEWFGDSMGWHPIGPECAKKVAKAGWEVASLPELKERDVGA